MMAEVNSRNVSRIYATCYKQTDTYRSVTDQRDMGKEADRTKRYQRRLNAATSKKADEDARKAEIKDAKDAAAAESAVNVEKHGLNLSDAEIEVHDDGLLYYILTLRRTSLGPL